MTKYDDFEVELCQVFFVGLSKNRPDGFMISKGHLGQVPKPPDRYSTVSTTVV